MIILEILSLVVKKGVRMKTDRIKKTFKIYSRRNFSTLPQIRNMPTGFKDDINAVASIIPFRVNNYVTDELIDWSNIPDDPIFQLTFPQPGMISPEDLETISNIQHGSGSDQALAAETNRIRRAMNPHPGGQIDKNVPSVNGVDLPGIQHKYPETVLFFPLQGQTCHTYCTYCFRWVQFAGMEGLKFASSKPAMLIRYLSMHPEVTDLLFTGGDPLVMPAATLRCYVEPLLTLRPGNLTTLRIGTKAPVYWPYRFITDSDADDLLRLFEEITAAGIHLSLMVHVSHVREIETVQARRAFKRIQETGAVIRCQAPVVRHVNDDPAAWADLWKAEVALGAVPYYMFVPRDTGPKDYFAVPLARALDIFTQAYQRVSGLCRTVRGPSMSSDPGKILLSGVADVQGRKQFVLKFIQARNPDWVNRPFFAEFDENAVWIDDLKPAFGEKQFFFENQ